MFLKGLRRRKVIACFFSKLLMFLCKFLIIIFLKFSYVTQSLFRICFSRFRSANYTLRSIQQWNQNLRSVQTKLAHAAQTNEDLKARLADNMRTLHNLESSLPHRVKNNDLRACPFAGPQHPSTYTLNYH